MPVSSEQIEQYREPLIKVWGDPVPPLTPERRAVASGIVEGKINFDKQPTLVGRSNIDWSGEQHHHHQEWRAQINRFFWINPIAAAYRETSDECYAEAARDLITDWMQAHPAVKNWTVPPYDSVLNLCIRIGNSEHRGWLGALPVLMQSAAFDADFVAQIIESCRAQLNYLYGNVAGSINWRIANADCLIVSGISLAFLPEAARWRERGVRIVNDAWHRQVLPDGAHYERNPSYHFWMNRVMANYWRLQQQMPELGFVMEASLIAKMFDYTLGCMRPNGSLNAMHDCQGERTGAHDLGILSSRLAFLREAGLMEHGLLADEGSDTMPPTSQYFPDAGQVFLRDGWSEDATYITFDATKWGGGHCHLSRNAIQLHANGRSLLVDPGYLTYESSDPFSAHGKSTRAHNTLSINGWNQDECDPREVQVLRSENYDFVRAEYEGAYWSGRYTWNFDQGRGDGICGNHHRMLLWLRGRFAIVIDSLVRDPRQRPESATAAPSVEANWQLCEGGKVSIEDDGGRVTAHYGDSNLMLLFPLRWPNLQVSVHEGERESLRGWLPVHRDIIPAPQVVVGNEQWTDQFLELTTVLLPYTDEAPKVTYEAYKTDGQKPGYVGLRWEDGTTDEFWWTYRGMIMIDQVGEIETDGGVLHLRKAADGSILHGCAIEATYVRGTVNTAGERPLAKPELIEFW